jgi:hypothetical protein
VSSGRIISAEDSRSIKALQIAAGAGHWLKCCTSDGRRVYGVPSQCKPEQYYLVDSKTCTCVDFRWHELSAPRIGLAGVQYEQHLARPKRSGDRVGQ